MGLLCSHTCAATLNHRHQLDKTTSSYERLSLACLKKADDMKTGDLFTQSLFENDN